MGAAAMGVGAKGVGAAVAEGGAQGQGGRARLPQRVGHKVWVQLVQEVLRVVVGKGRGACSGSASPVAGWARG